MDTYSNDLQSEPAPQSHGFASHGVEWAHEHPYQSALIAAGAFLVFGMLIVGYRAAQPQGGGLQVWGGAPNAFLDSTSYETGTLVDTPAETIGGGNTPVFNALSPSREGNTQNSAGYEFDMAAFIAALSQPNGSTAQNPPASGSADLSLSYAFIPSGLVATTTPGPRRSAMQESLYQYGNDVGSYVSTYEDAHANAGQVLTNQVQDRQNPQKAQAVKDIGAALQATGKSLQDIENIPSVASAVHAALAESYIDAGVQLAKVPDAQSDRDFIAAIEAYNAAAARLAHNYTALADIFAGVSVRFAPQDPGAVFSFSGNAGL